MRSIFERELELAYRCPNGSLMTRAHTNVTFLLRLKPNRDKPAPFSWQPDCLVTIPFKVAFSRSKTALRFILSLSMMGWCTETESHDSNFPIKSNCQMACSPLKLIPLRNNLPVKIGRLLRSGDAIFLLGIIRVLFLRTIHGCDWRIPFS